MKIRFCKNNKGKGKVVRRLQEEFPEMNIKIKDCVKQCSVCRDQPMAVVDKVKVTGKDGEDLYVRVIELIGKSSSSNM